MPKFYAVELSVLAIVAVGDDEDGLEAEAVAEDERRDIFSDCDQPDVTVLGEIKTVKDLDQYGWDGMCLPYGDRNVVDGNTRLKDLLPSE